MDPEQLQFLNDFNKAQHDLLLAALQDPTNSPSPPPLSPKALRDQIIRSQINAILLRNPPVKNRGDPVALGINLLTAVYQAPQNQREELASYLRHHIHQARMVREPDLYHSIVKHLDSARSRIQGMVRNRDPPTQQAPTAQEEQNNAVPDQENQEGGDARPVVEEDPDNQDQDVQAPVRQAQVQNNAQPAQQDQEAPGEQDQDIQDPADQQQLLNHNPPPQQDQEDEDDPPAHEVNPGDQDQEDQDRAGQVDVANNNQQPQPVHQGLPAEQNQQQLHHHQLIQASPVLWKLITDGQNQQAQAPPGEDQLQEDALQAQENQVGDGPQQVLEEPLPDQNQDVQVPADQEQVNLPAQQNQEAENAPPVLQDPPAVQNRQDQAPAGQDQQNLPAQQNQEAENAPPVLQDPPAGQIPEVGNVEQPGSPDQQSFLNPPALQMELITILHEHLQPVPIDPENQRFFEMLELPRGVAPVPEGENPARVDKSLGFRELCIRHEYFKRNSIQEALENYTEFYDTVEDEEIADMLPELPRVLNPCRIEPVNFDEPLRGQRNTVKREDGWDTDSDDDEMEENIGLLFTDEAHQMMRSWYKQMALMEVDKMMHNDGPQVFTRPERIYDFLPIQNIIDISYLGRKTLPIQYISVQHSHRKLAIMIGEYDTEISILEYWSTDRGCLFQCKNQFRFVQGTKYQTLAANHLVWILKNLCVPLEKLSFSARTPFFRRFDPPIWPFGSFFRKFGKALGTQKIGIFAGDLILEAPKYEGRPEEGVKIFESILPHVYKAEALLLSTWDDTKLLEKRNIQIEDPHIIIGEHFKPDANMRGWYAAKTLYLHPDRIRVCNFDYLFDPYRECIGLKMGREERYQIKDLFNRKGSQMKVESCEVVPHSWSVLSTDEEDDMIANDTVRTSIRFVRKPEARID